MRTISLRPGTDLGGFRAAVRTLVAEGVGPDDVVWSTEGAPSLFGAGRRPQRERFGPPICLPRPVAELIETAVRHRDPERYALLYQLIWRVLHRERQLLEFSSDPLVHRLETMAKAVRRDIHKMHAFVRFRQAKDEDERYIAFFEPEHFILEVATPFFVDRFRALRWSILTPIGTASA